MRRTRIREEGGGPRADANADDGAATGAALVRGPDDTANLGTRLLPGQRPESEPQGEPAAEPGEPGRRRKGKKPKKRKPLWRRILVWTAGSLAFLLAALAVAGWLYIRHLNNNLTKEELNLGDNPLEGPEPNAAGQTPLNILLLGSDSREGLSEEEQEALHTGDAAGNRADTQILLHASADRSNMTLISVPRDTQVTIPRCTDPKTGQVYEETYDSINNSISHGGPGCAVATWEELTGIPIQHFMMVDFEGVVEMADAVGGVPVCVDANVNDPDSGLYMEEGEHTIQGAQALQWLRTRHGFEDGSDIGRAKAQQMYLSNMARELQGSTSLTDPAELMNLAESATNALTVDHGLGSVQKLYDLGEDLRQVPNKRVNMVTMPWEPDPENPTVTVVPAPGTAENLFSLVREDIPIDRPEQANDAPEEPRESESPEESAAPADPEAEIPVAVQNGTGYGGQLPVDGRAGDITEELVRLGFASAVTDLTLASEESTLLLYPAEDDRANAEAVAEALGVPGSALRISPSSTQITLVVGADWAEGTSYPAQDDGGSGGSGSGGSGGGGNTPINPDDIISGQDKNTCMAVNPVYTW
ncbi:LCP family protein [Streptomyces sp. 6N223]|uniref:LCP family protein n=1 Tax=Streptomyces sp. 6N223 TaxID=3457412 RepID=UPI003FD198BE